MVSETFDEACKLIIELLKLRDGSADIKTILEEFERRGISRATAYRALDKLISVGAIRRFGRGVYQLAEKSYALLAEELGKELCDLIRCQNAEVLKKDILEGLGGDLTKINEVYNIFINDIIPSLRKLGINDFYISLMSALYKSKAIFTLTLMESIKLMTLKKLIDEGCNDIFLGLPDKYNIFLRKTIEANVENFNRFFKINVNDIYDPLMKLRKILVNHGFKDVIWVRVLLTDIPINMREMVTLSIAIFYGDMERMGTKNAIQCATTLYDIADSLIKSGCRPLGTKEREELIKSCEDIVKHSIK